MQDAGAEEILDVAGACELLKIKDRTLRKWIKSKAVPHSRLGGILRFRRSSLVAWVAEHETRNEGGDHV